jgi:hypothetical protein
VSLASVASSSCTVISIVVDVDAFVFELVVADVLVVAVVVVAVVVLDDVALDAFDDDVVDDVAVVVVMLAVVVAAFEDDVVYGSAIEVAVVAVGNVAVPDCNASGTNITKKIQSETNKSSSRKMRRFHVRRRLDRQRAMRHICLQMQCVDTKQINQRIRKATPFNKQNVTTNTCNRTNLFRSLERE